MIALAAIPVLIGLALFAGAEALGRRLPPRVGVPLLTALSLSVALCTGLILSAVAVLTVAQLGPAPRIGHWSGRAVQQEQDLPVAVGLAAFAIVAVCLSGAGVRAARSVRDLVRADRVSRQLQPTTGNLVLVDDSVPTAYSVAGRHARVVVSTAMLTALSPEERRVLLAHERAHLCHRHHLYLHLTRLAAAANPLLRPTSRAVAYGVERWADEAAASEVGDRSLTARALARAALARAGHSTAHGALAAADDRVPDRVRALLTPRRYRWTTIALVAAAAGASWLAAGLVTIWANNVIQIAESVYARH
jgi:beta-lactamase regulating signal transducer with metallopeptidase domain